MGELKTIKFYVAIEKSCYIKISAYITGHMFFVIVVGSREIGENIGKHVIFFSFSPHSSSMNEKKPKRKKNVSSHNVEEILLTKKYFYSFFHIFIHEIFFFLFFSERSNKLIFRGFSFIQKK